MMTFRQHWQLMLNEHIINKKTTYALKTPSVVALPFIYGVECIIISNQKRGKK